MKKFIAGCLSAALLLTAAGCTADESGVKQESSAEKVTLVLDWTPNTNHTGFYVALQNGYFADEGIEVEIVQPNEGDAPALVAAGSAQFGVGNQDSMVRSLTGENTMPITAVAALLQHNTSGIMSRGGEGMDQPKGLEGKKYATWDQPLELAMIKNVVEADGGRFDDVVLIPSTVTDEVTALRTNMVDALWVFYGWGGIQAQVEGMPIDYFAFKDINPAFDYYTPVLIANNDFLEQKPETAKAFLRATQKGYEFATEQPEEAASILVQQVPELDAQWVTESQKYLSQQYKAEVERWGYIDAARWDGFYQWLFDNELIEQPIPKGEGFTNEYLPE